VPVQHHQAHVASVLAEHQVFDEPVVGVAFDGTGYGSDGSIWGGEFFVGSLRTGFERAAALRAVRLPGGDAAARFPVQAAAGFLADLGELPDLSGPPFLFPRRFHHALALVSKDLRCFVSTSVGRLFDAVAALLGFTHEVTFEGQAAMWLEHLAGQAAPQAPFDFADLDHRPLFAAILADRLAGRERAEIAAAFHASLVAATVAKIRELCARHHLQTLALSGGVFQNEILLDGILHAIHGGQLALNLLMNQSVPAGDGGIALGQSALASVQAD
jgi:hydrogenase maturation protein HypF